MNIKSRKIHAFSIFILIIISIFSSCKKDTIIDDNENDYTYANLQVGNWIEYSVSEIKIDEESKVNDTSNYYIKEIITEKFTDLTNEDAFRIERYLRMEQTDNWIIKDVWSAQIVDKSYQKVEEDVRLKKIVFPVVEGNTWDGNIFNTNAQQIYEITSLDKPETINQQAFDSVLTVTQINESNLIEKKLSVEKFAKNIGLVYKEITDIYSSTVIPGVDVEDRITTASILKMKIIQYGSN